MLPSPFPAARYRFEFTVEAPIRLPEYAGSTLRGVFGNALRRTACMTRERDCKPCPLYRTCPYPAVFETPPPAGHALQNFSQIPNPFVIEPPDWGERIYAPGETLAFQLVLVGQSLKHLPLIVYAWQRAFEHGVGKRDGTARLQRIDHEGVTVYAADEGKLREHEPTIGRRLAAEPRSHDTLSDTAATGRPVSLRFDTPLRLQRNGRPLGAAELTARDLLIGLVRRTALICEFHLGHKLDLDFHALAEASATIESEKHLRWRDWKRYSNRQKQEMALGGVVGDWTLGGDLAPFLPFLHLGQWLHVGKNATFGLGRYEIADDAHAIGRTMATGKHSPTPIVQPMAAEHRR